MKAALSVSMCGSGSVSPAGMNCGRNAKKKIDSFGLRMLISTPVMVTSSTDCSRSSRSILSGPCSLSVIQAIYSR